MTHKEKDGNGVRSLAAGELVMWRGGAFLKEHVRVRESVGMFCEWWSDAAGWLPGSVAIIPVAGI